eukprot:9484214-Pyramimonas_sp.AAC.4
MDFPMTCKWTPVICELAPRPCDCEPPDVLLLPGGGSGCEEVDGVPLRHVAGSSRRQRYVGSFTMAGVTEVYKVCIWGVECILAVIGTGTGGPWTFMAEFRVWSQVEPGCFEGSGFHMRRWEDKLRFPFLKAYRTHWVLTTNRRAARAHEVTNSACPSA